jgi:hypothetical protein
MIISNMESFDGMKKAVLFLAMIILSCIPLASADISFEFIPEPLHGQVWAYETYLVNTTGPQVNSTDPEYVELDLTGNLIYNYTIRWRGVGQYHHGTGVTGYSYDLQEKYFQRIVHTGDNSLINVTLEKDAYRLGMKPYEEVQIVIEVDAYLELDDEGSGVYGPLVESHSRTMLLVDDDKTGYLEDKFLELQEEVNLTVNTLGLTDFNRSKFLAVVESMNQSLAIGDYSEALDIWDRWDRKERVRMFAGFANIVDAQSEELERLQDIDVSLEDLQTEYDFLEDKYVAVFTENRLNLDELEATKQGLTTAITGVFLSAIVFFFLGRRTINGEDM